MIKVNLSYNPYRMKTVLEINGENAIKSSTYGAFVKYIDGGIPLQTWIDPIPHDGWKGFIPAIVQDSGETKLELLFSGREIDFKDLERAIAAQNQDLGDNAVEVTYKKHLFISDKDLGVNIDKAVKEMLSKRFSDLVNASNSPLLLEKYKELEESYRRAKSKEFKIIFAGLYSSGKSTLINALIGKELLPTSDETCTAKVCKIKHKKNVQFAQIQCLDKDDKIIVPLEKFQNPEALSARFDELCPIKEPSRPPEIDKIEIYTDLSALYPAGFENKFNLVIVDTPGTNSGEGNNNITGEKHIDITIDAIQAKEKEMVIIVVDGQDYADESLLRLLGEIDGTVQKDCGGFNDRFLFLMNKCDNKKYATNKGIEVAIEGYANYLKGSGQDSQKRMITPRIFPVCAAPALAIKSGCTDKENVKSQEAQNLLSNYNSFSEHCEAPFGAENYHLEDFCSSSEYVRDCLNEKLEVTEDKVAQILIHTGLPSVEESIKEYIERYAYPIKVRDLLSSFDSILSEVTGKTEYYQRTLAEAVEMAVNMELKKKDAQKEEIEKRKRKETLEKAKQDIGKANEEIETIAFDESGILKLKRYVQSDLFTPKEIQKFKKTYPSESEARAVVQTIETMLQSAFQEIENEFSAILKKEESKAQELVRKLNATLEKLKQDKVFELNGFDFTKTVAYQNYLKANSVDDLSSQIEEKITSIPNPQKAISYGWWQFIKKGQQRKAPDKIDKTSYKIDFVLLKLDTLKITFNSLCDDMRTIFMAYIECLKGEIIKRQDNILELVGQSQAELEMQMAEINKISNDAVAVEKEKQQVEGNLQWIARLTQSIESVISNNI